MKTLRMLSLDVSLTCTGYAVWRILINEDGATGILLDGYDVIPLNDGETDTRIRKLLDRISELIDQYRINCVYLEEVKGGFIGNKATASSLMKVIAACYAIIGYLHAHNIYCRTFSPSMWHGQLGLKKGMDSKKWSNELANNALKYFGINKILKTKKDANAADAINIGSFVIQNLASGKFIVPGVEDSNV